MKKIKWTDLAIFIVGTELIGALSALISGGGKDFYETVTQPPLSPPGVVFPIVWAILYALMGYSAYLVYSADEYLGDERRRGLGIYAVQLVVNFMWSIVFFRMRLFAAATAIAALLAVLVFFMIKNFRRVNETAGNINIPYLLWSIFATYLAGGVCYLNR